jgi:nucleotide-binding universal stress UspA family protein
MATKLDMPKPKILICSDGHAQAENAIRFIAPVAAAREAEVTLLGIIENEKDEKSLREALERGAGILREKNLEPKLVARTGEPVDEIRKQTAEVEYDLVIIGAERKGAGDPSCMSEKAYSLIKLIEPPVLAVIGNRMAMRKILICSGGKRYIDKAVELVGRIAGGSGVKATILHVMAEPPAMYADMIRQEEDVKRLLASQSDLGRNLLREKEALDAKGIQAEVRLRHGLVLRELFEEIRHGDFDVIVTGFSGTAGALGNYIMGDVTSEIVNAAECPVLVVRGSQSAKGPGLISRIFGLGSKGGKERSDDPGK